MTTKEQRDFMKAAGKAMRAAQKLDSDGVFHSLQFWARENKNDFVFKVYFSEAPSQFIKVSI